MKRSLIFDQFVVFVFFGRTIRGFSSSFFLSETVSWELFVIADFVFCWSWVLEACWANTIVDKLKRNISLEFCWIIELLDIKIKINDDFLDYEKYKEPTVVDSGVEIENETFDLKFIKWKQQLKNQSSRYYLLDSKKA